MNGLDTDRLWDVVRKRVDGNKVSKRRVVVPEGMLKAAYKAWSDEIREGYSLPHALELALKWLSENPIVPTIEDVGDIIAGQSFSNYGRAAMHVAVEWQRRCFLAPVDEVPEEVKDLIQPIPVSGAGADPWKRLPIDVTNERIIEAFKRGQRTVQEENWGKGAEVRKRAGIEE